MDSMSGYRGAQGSAATTVPIRWDSSLHIHKKSISKPNILGFISGYNAHRRAGKSAHLASKKTKNIGNVANLHKVIPATI
jgi:hypothetical protein